MLIPSTFIGNALQGSTSSFPSILVTTGASSMEMMAVGPIASKLATSVALPVALSLVGGGGFFGGATPPANAAHFFTAGVFDIGRVKMRLEGFQAYGTICALLMNACLQLFSPVRHPKEEDTPFNKRAFDVFTLCVIASVLYGSYTTIVFTMISLYSKQALGRGLDPSFLEFYEATQVFRDSGFRSFLYSLVSFQGAFVLSLFLKLKGEQRQKWMVAIASLVAFVSFWRWSTVMALASKLIYQAQ
jgi:hypothetical protein